MTAGIVALICILDWPLRLNIFVNFISETILFGFKAGAVLRIASTQLPKLLRVPSGGDHFFERLLLLGRQLGDTNPFVFMVGISLALLAIGEHLFLRRPVALMVVVLSIALVPFLGLDRHGLIVIGVIPAELPLFGLPVIGIKHVEDLVAFASPVYSSRISRAYRRSGLSH
jgi:MFS superfamily sulfate permease-like transporter